MKPPSCRTCDAPLHGRQVWYCSRACVIGRGKAAKPRWCRQCATPLHGQQQFYCSRACVGLNKARARDCERCSKGLTKRQIGDDGRYCSRACASASRVVVRQVRLCPACGKALRSSQFKNPGGHCSAACGLLTAQPGPMRAAILDILRANTHAWMTISDLAIWTYGDDRPADCRAVQQLFYYLRRGGYVIASRRAAWEWVQGPSRAYRLIFEPSSATGRAVA